MVLGDGNKSTGNEGLSGIGCVADDFSPSCLPLPWNTESHLGALKLAFTGYKSGSYPGDPLLSLQGFYIFFLFLNCFQSFLEDCNNFNIVLNDKLRAWPQQFSSSHFLLQPHFCTCHIIFVLGASAIQELDSAPPFQSLLQFYFLIRTEGSKKISFWQFPAADAELFALCCTFLLFHAP